MALVGNNANKICNIYLSLSAYIIPNTTSFSCSVLTSVNKISVHFKDNFTPHIQLLLKEQHLRLQNATPFSP